MDPYYRQEWSSIIIVSVLPSAESEGEEGRTRASVVLLGAECRDPMRTVPSKRI